MKKAVLLGDSIRQQGYGKRVEELLKGTCQVWQPQDNGRFAKYTLRMLYDYQEEIKGADVIHWNNGLWDVCEIFNDGPFTPLEEYVENMLRIARLLKSQTPKLIFATTTPVHPEYPGHDLKRTRLYNETLVEKLREQDVMINDLFTAMLPHRQDGICEDLLHLNEKGVRICGDLVAGAILRALEEKR